MARIELARSGRLHFVYTALLGWRTKPETGAESAPYVEWVTRWPHIGGLMPMRGDMWEGAPPHWMIDVTVADCDERAQHAGELGATICVSPTDIPNTGRFSVITDAQGAVFSIIQMASSHQQATA